MSKVLPGDTNDQVRLNVALKAMNVKWNNSLHGSYTSILKEAWQGKGIQGFTVTVLPSTIMCRARECHRHHRSSYYVWHSGGKHEDGKRKYAAGAGLWYLRTDWMAIMGGYLRHLVKCYVSYQLCGAVWPTETWDTWRTSTTIQLDTYRYSSY